MLWKGTPSYIIFVYVCGITHAVIMGNDIMHNAVRNSFRILFTLELMKNKEKHLIFCCKNGITFIFIYFLVKMPMTFFHKICYDYIRIQRVVCLAERNSSWQATLFCCSTVHMTSLICIILYIFSAVHWLTTTL